MQIADVRVRQVVYGRQDVVLCPRRKYRLVVTDLDETVPEHWMMTCTCEDFQRHAEQEMALEDLEKRKRNSRNLAVVDEQSKYGARLFKVVTKDGKNGDRFNDVTLVKGGGDKWVCKHMIAVLYFGAVTPEPELMDIVLQGEGVPVNGVVVVGWKRL